MPFINRILGLNGRSITPEILRIESSNWIKKLRMGQASSNPIPQLQRERGLSFARRITVRHTGLIFPNSEWAPSSSADHFWIPSNFETLLNQWTPGARQPARSYLRFHRV
jgi:hypothetical protein